MAALFPETKQGRFAWRRSGSVVGTKNSIEIRENADFVESRKGGNHFAAVWVLLASAMDTSSRKNSQGALDQHYQT
jgi:hypothetical protein